MDEFGNIHTIVDESVQKEIVERLKEVKELHPDEDYQLQVSMASNSVMNKSKIPSKD